MNTIKSAAMLVVLLGVLYGVYMALSKPDVIDRTPPTGDAGPPLIEWGNSGAMPPAPSYPRESNNNWAPQTSNTSPASAYPASNVELAAATSSGSSPASFSGPSSDGKLAQTAYEAPTTTATNSSGPESPQDTAPATSPPSDNAAAPASASSASALAGYDLRRDLTEAEQLIAENKFKTALAKLTPHYLNQDLASDQRTVLYSWLDALAAKVIYSREHLLAAAHPVRKGETLYDVAHQYNVEYRLLQNINSRDVTDPLILVPATELKVVPGPFRADVNLTTNEVTLLVGELYAGRFPFSPGDQPPQPGDYKVIDKRSQQKTYVGFDGRMIPGNDPANPFGGWWISLGGEVAIHGSPSIPGDKTLGCISLSPQDAKDIYGILSIGSEVRIR